MRNQQKRRVSAGKPALKKDSEDSEMTVWCQERAQAMALPKLAKKVRVIWNSRMRTTAGRAWWPHCQIELNPKLRDFSEEEVWRTLKHEFAHLVAYERCGRRRIRPHGIEWQAACADLGIAGESARHSLPFKARKMERKHTYRCRACDAVTSRVRPFRRAVACYECCKKHNAGAYHDRFRLIKDRV
jgi:predicted SprT family Zn-dependent metalloprotease